MSLSLGLWGLAATARADTGSSSNLLVRVSLHERVFLISRSNLATRDGVGDLFFGYTGGGLGFALSEQWSLRAAYRRAWIRPQDDWLPENRLFAEGYFADVLAGVRLTSRSRFEFRFFDHRDDDVRIRNEFTVQGPWRLTPLALRVYAEEEFFLSVGERHLEANWLGAGLAWFPRQGVKLKLGYRWVHQRIGDAFIDRHTLVTGVNLFF
ncbi:DUF2490 domain-containing protein [Haliangium ochraceum]|uniref:DUF2490 domain-containing protein n=1 Tax=Haliangium ochraceum TaxID=80816 RepID=UPI00019BA7F2|nr:DUF2490 domain-containing protein [Haliangium ochraceum]